MSMARWSRLPTCPTAPCPSEKAKEAKMKTTSNLAVLCVLLLASAAQAAPQIKAILNAASYTRTGLPNSGIAPGSLFVVFGTELGPAVLQQANGFPLPPALGGTSVRIT